MPISSELEAPSPVHWKASCIRLKRELSVKRFVIAAAVLIAASLATQGPVFAKGGHGRGHHGFATSHHGYHGYPPGWYRGRKVGWRGYGCPPGLWKQGRC
jgi:hypothetical protein